MTELEKYSVEIKELVARQRLFFVQGKTKEIEYRICQLKRLGREIDAFESRILDALRVDLGKSPEEGWLTEISIVQSEIQFHIRHLKKWSAWKRVSTPLQLFPSKSYRVFEPFGVVLILSPWNYPFQLLINPLIGAISAGNCAVLKPSPLCPATNQVIKEIIARVFSPEYVCVIEGDSEQTHRMLKETFDFIFFTGSPAFGKEVMKAAAEHLTPVVLELGGKSPCIVDCESNVDMAAKKIVWGKLLNAGQTCVAPDYLLVHHSLEQNLIEALIRHITDFYGKNTAESPYYPRIISGSAVERLKSYLNDGEIVFGGDVREQDRFMGPVIMRNVKLDSALMENEIFGPIFPVLTYQNIDEAIEYINARPKPLALYYFGKAANGKKIIGQIPSGGTCINDVILHLANHHLPFGGVGNSGMGKYHGRDSFKTFSNERAILISSAKIDFPFKYVPFKYFSFVKKIL